MIAVNDLDIHARVGHAAGDHAQLAGNILSEFLNEHLANIEDLDADILLTRFSRFAVLEKKMHRRLTIRDPTAAALDANAGRTKCLAHLSHCSGAVL